MEAGLNLELCAFEIKRITNKINTLIYHIHRCKEVKDKIKLITMISANSAYVASLVIEVKKEMLIIKDSLFIN